VIPAWLTGIGAKLAAVGLVLLGIGIVVLKLLGAGRAAERADQLKRNAEAKRRGDEVDSRVDAAGVTELGRLRDKWTRKP
jgi:hypothetical protein